jgi:hypothetical protein
MSEMLTHREEDESKVSLMQLRSFGDLLENIHRIEVNNDMLKKLG